MNFDYLFIVILFHVVTYVSYVQLVFQKLDDGPNNGVQKSNVVETGENSSFWKSSRHIHKTLRLRGGGTHGGERCFMCEHVAMTADLLNVHINNEHLLGPTACPWCKNVFNSSDLLNQHVNDKHLLNEPTDNSCPSCKHTFNSSAELEDHYYSTHPEGDSDSQPSQQPVVVEADTCPICNSFKSLNIEELLDHSETCYGEKDVGEVEEQNLPQTENTAVIMEPVEEKLVGEFDMTTITRQTIESQDSHLQNVGEVEEQNLYQAEDTAIVTEPVVEKFVSEFDLSTTRYTIESRDSYLPNVIGRIKQRIIKRRYAKYIEKTNLCSTEVDFYSYNTEDARWGCGYRNFQMLLSAMLRTKKYGDIVRQHFKKFGVEVKNIAPSILTLRKAIEYAWSIGFDTDDQRALAGDDLAAQKKWIGPNEIKSVFSTMKIRTELVDVIKHKKTKVHKHVVGWMLAYFSSEEPDKLPLYFQRDGHSRTAVGVETHDDGDYVVWLLDPAITINEMYRGSKVPDSTMKLVRVPGEEFDGSLYQMLKVTGIMESEDEYEASKLVISDDGLNNG